MGVSTSPKVAIGPGVQEFLRKQGAELSFQTICDLIRECFPEALAIEVELQEDYDEPGWQRVRTDFLVPTPQSWDLHHQRWRTFDEKLFEKVPLELVPLFLTIDRYATE